MFSNLRVGTQLYVLHKEEPKVEVGEVQSVSTPIPQIGMTYAAGYMQPQKMLVDIKVKVGDNIVDLQKLPADQTIADFGTNGMVISETKDGIINEINNLRKSSQSVIDSIDRHKNIVDVCKQLIEDLNPQAKAEAEQRKDIDELKTQMLSIQDMLTQLLSTKGKEK